MDLSLLLNDEAPEIVRESASRWLAAALGPSNGGPHPLAAWILSIPEHDLPALAEMLLSNAAALLVLSRLTQSLRDDAVLIGYWLAASHLAMIRINESQAVPEFDSPKYWLLTTHGSCPHGE